jgi:putative flippase GtrA
VSDVGRLGHGVLDVPSQVTAGGRPRSWRWLQFAVVGSVGFAVDAGLLSLLMGAGWPVLQARAVSFLVAVSCTWAINRAWTFQDRRSAVRRGAYAVYVLAQLLGAGVNLGCFFVLIRLWPALLEVPVVPLGIGAMVSLVFNFGCATLFVFQVRPYGR